jgi:hypothetical protein
MGEMQQCPDQARLGSGFNIMRLASAQCAAERSAGALRHRKAKSPPFEKREGWATRPAIKICNQNPHSKICVQNPPFEKREG